MGEYSSLGESGCLRKVLYSRIVQICLGFVFCADAVMKIIDAQDMLNDLTATGAAVGVPLNVGAALAMVRLAVMAEGAIGVLLLQPSSRRLGAIGAVSLLGVYSVLLTTKWVLLGGVARCGCLTWLGNTPVWVGIVRNASLIAVLMWTLGTGCIGSESNRWGVPVHGAMDGVRTGRERDDGEEPPKQGG